MSFWRVSVDDCSCPSPPWSGFPLSLFSRVVELGVKYEIPHLEGTLGHFHLRGKAAHAIPCPPAGEELASPEEGSRPPSPPGMPEMLKALGTCHYAAAESLRVASSGEPTALSDLRNRGLILKPTTRLKKEKKSPRPLIAYQLAVQMSFL